MSIPTVGLVSQIDFLNPACFTPGGTAVTDLSGNGNNWTFTNNAYTYDATFGTITFPVGNAPLTCSKFYSGNTPFTISYWFFWDAANPIAHTLRLGDYATGTNFITFMQQSPSHMSFYIGTNVYNGPQYAETPDGVLLDQQYNNVCVTFDGTTCKTYVNNVNYDTFSATINQTGSDPVVFNDFVGNPYWLRGLGLANFYDVGLTSGEVTQLYNDGYARFNPPPTPIAEYSPFDSASYPGTGNTWFDLTANNNDLSLVNQTFTSSPIKSFSFTNGYAYKASPANFPTNIFTIDAWIKFSGSGSQIIYALGKDGSGTVPLLGYKFPSENSGKPFFEMGGGVARLNLTLDPTPDTWYNYVITADGSTIKSYVDGVLDISVAQSGSAIASTNPGLILGQFLNGSGAPSGTFYSNATYGQFNVYSSALDATAVLDLYNSTKNTYASPERLYDFSDPACYPGTGNTVYNLAQASYNLTRFNSPTFVSDGQASHFVFDRASQQYLGFGNNSTNIGGPYSTMTINVWFQSTDSSAFSTLFSFGYNNPAGVQPTIFLNDSSAGLTPGKASASFNYGVGFTNTTNTFTTNTWNMITMVADGTNTKIYLNGVLEGTAAQGGGTWPNVGGSYIGSLGDAGGNSWSTAPFFSGKVAILEQWDVAYTDSEVLALYNLESSRFAPPPYAGNVGGRSFGQGFNG